MQTLEARVLSVVKLQPRQIADKSEVHREVRSLRLWRMRVSYHGPQTLYEIELREPLKSLASKKQTVGLNGLVEFALFSQPDLAAGDSILIDAYEPGEKILG